MRRSHRGGGCDVCLNEGRRLIITDRLDRIISFDQERGILRAEAGLTLERMLRVTVPHGWFAPVVPVTKFVTLGGASPMTCTARTMSRSALSARM